MNWLMYIGGGYVFITLYIYVINACIGLALGSTSRTKIIDPLIEYLPPLMVWIWICWKFIR